MYPFYAVSQKGFGTQHYFQLNAGKMHKEREAAYEAGKMKKKLKQSRCCSQFLVAKVSKHFQKEKA